MPAGQRPNFIVILVDDLGYDDIGLHHPRGPDGRSSIGAQTPNIDRLIKRGMSFSNFYSTPLCAMSRAELLTGRDFVRTGTVYNTLGYDSFSLGEATAGDVMQQAGYTTSHFGKWHNGRALGYEPWSRGFNESWLPSDYIHLDNLMRHNGAYKPTEGLMEQVLMDKLLGFLKKRQADGQPFFTYYAPFSIHKSPREEMPKEGTPLDLYFAPEPYLSQVMDLEPRPDPHTARLWAMLKYWDEVLGRLLDFVESSPLAKNTYIMMAGDNGPGLPRSVFDDNFNKLRRMPSGMLGHKGYWDPAIKAAGTEGGLRNHLAVAGPGVPSGSRDDTLLSLADVLPTVADLARAKDTQHMPWSGSSFANLLKPGAQPSKQQQERFFFTMTASGDAKACPHAATLMRDTLPQLSHDRKVLKPQPDLLYQDRNGTGVFKNCIVGRWKDYKWYGANNKVFKFTGDSRVELPCNAVTGPEQQRIAALFDSKAQLWWGSVVAEPHSFTKLVFQLGLNGEAASNVETAGAIQLTRGNVHIKGSAVNFTDTGDNACMQLQVDTPGRYDVAAMYYSRTDALGKGDGQQLNFTFKVSVGTFQQIKADSVPSVKAVLPQTPGMTTKSMGTLELAKSPPNSITEVCAQLVAMHNASKPLAPRNGQPAPQKWFFHLFNLRFVLLDGQGKAAAVAGSPAAAAAAALPAPGSAAGKTNSTAAAAGGKAADTAAAGAAAGKAANSTAAVDVASVAIPPSGSPPEGMPADVPMQVQTEPAKYQNFQPTANMLELERQLRAAASTAGGVAVATHGQPELHLPADAAAATATSAASGMRMGSSSSGVSGAAAAAAVPVSPEQVWRRLQRQHQWPDGQLVFQSMYRPCVIDEANEMCVEDCGLM
uniref:Sulfatase N-terminal domain-containing protein n=1 Tax=Tetradesmus obliquus TaxID=3088 RepID=A0A383VC43_TETOB|eukprot:jgi/Sobl393_1/17765/SZX63147.1